MYGGSTYDRTMALHTALHTALRTALHTALRTMALRTEALHITATQSLRT